MKRIHRSQLKNAPYNPRKIDPYARKKLIANLNRVGLIQPLIWNERSGNIVGGHQRIEGMDILEKTNDYFLDVAVVDLDDKTEREQNLFLNNTAVQGTWDEDRLLDLIQNQETKINTESAGFDRLDLEFIFAETERAKTLFSQEGASAESKQIIAQMQEITDALKPTSTQSSLPTSELTESLPSTPPPIIPDEKKKWFHEQEQKWVKKREAMKDDEFILVVVFNDRAHRESFLSKLKQPKDDKFIDATKLEFLCGMVEK